MKAPQSNLHSVELTVYNRPSFREDMGKRWVSRGKDNLFPVYLIDLYNQSNTHGAVVDGKVSYEVGRGLYAEGNLIDVARCEQFLKRPNPFENWDSIFKKITLDYEIHNSYALEILRNKQGTPVEVYFVDISRVCVDSVNQNVILYSLDWETKYSTPEARIRNLNPTILEIPKFNAKEIQPRSILIHYEPRPGMKYYALPPYINGLEAIEEEIEIGQYHLNNVKNGFVGGTMINFLNGEPENAEKKAIEDSFNAKFTGGKGSKVLYNFAIDKEHAAEVLPLQPNNLDKQFETRAVKVPEAIIVGHRGVSGMLFGIKTEGQLGGRTELLEAYELFKETYVKPRQDTLLNSINKVFEIFGFAPIIKVKELKPLSNILPLTESTIAQIVPNQVLLDYVSEMYGLTIPKVVQPTPIQQSTQFYFETVGESADKYEIVEEHHIEFENETPKFHYSELEFADDKAEGSGGGTAAPAKIAPLVIKYRYALRPDAPALQTESRDFCQRMMRLNKLYTKKEIEGMQNDMDNFDIINNSNVWLYRGGWYRSPNMNVAVPFCRHTWSQVLVREK
jgi:hypothetical protein